MGLVLPKQIMLVKSAFQTVFEANFDGISGTSPQTTTGLVIISSGWHKRERPNVLGVVCL